MMKIITIELTVLRHLKNNYIFFVVILLFFVIGCIKPISNSDIIKKYKVDIVNNKEFYWDIINLVHSMHINSNKYSIIYGSKTHTVSITDKESGWGIDNISEELKKQLWEPLYLRRCYIFVNSNESIRFIFNKEYNENKDNISVICHIRDDINFKEIYSNYEIIEGDALPSRIGGWIYVVNNQWVIMSPFKKKPKYDENKVNQVNDSNILIM